MVYLNYAIGTHSINASFLPVTAAECKQYRKSYRGFRQFEPMVSAATKPISNNFSSSPVA